MNLDFSGLSSNLDELNKTMQIVNRDYTMADRKYEIIKEEIDEFQSTLSDEFDVVVALASFGSSIIMQVTSIGYQNPDVMYFYGYVNGSDAQLIQHVSQLNFLLMATKKENPEDKPRRIGFTSDDN